MLHQHKLWVYKGKRKLKLLITCENFVLFCALTVFILLCKYFLRKCGKKVYIWGFLERVSQVTVKHSFFFFFFFFFLPNICIWNKDICISRIDIYINSEFPQALENLENGWKNFHAWKNHGIWKFMKSMEFWHEIAFLMSISLNFFLARFACSTVLQKSVFHFWTEQSKIIFPSCPSVESPWTQWTLSGWSIGTRVHGQCPLSPWTMSTQSMDSVHSVHGQCPLRPWTMSLNPWTMSTQSLHFFPGFSLHFIWYRIIVIQPNWMHTSSS